MTTVVLGERPPELEAYLDRRRVLGLDGHDEMWDGVYRWTVDAHAKAVAPLPPVCLGGLRRPARATGLVA